METVETSATTATRTTVLCRPLYAVRSSLVLQGSRWYAWVSRQRNAEPAQRFLSLFLRSKDRRSEVICAGQTRIDRVAIVP